MNEVEISRFFPHWRIVRLLGQGGFGKVFEIERDQLGKTEKAALKLIQFPPDNSFVAQYRADGYDDESIRKRIREEVDNFSKEYSNMRKLTHTNIVKCDDIEYEYLDGGFRYNLYLKMELLTPLTEAVRYGFDSEAVAVRLAKDICSALVQCESRNIVHRDIKPDNLFVNEYGEYKLGDFGISREMEHLTTATVAGSYRFMSPEVFHHQPYNHNVDIYSLGLVLYWLLNEKRTPFIPLPPRVPSYSEDSGALMRRLNGEQLPPPKYGSPGLKRIVLKACEPDRTKRYQSAREMLADLRALGNRNNYPPKDNFTGTKTVAADNVYIPPKEKNFENYYGYKGDVKADAKETTAAKKKSSEAPYGTTTHDKYYSGLLITCIIAAAFVIVISYGANLTDHLNVWHIIGCGGFIAISGFIFYNRYDTSRSARIALSVVMTVALVAGVSYSSLALKDAYKQKSGTISASMNVGTVDTSEKADKLYADMLINEPEEIEEKYKASKFKFVNCIVDTKSLTKVDPTKDRSDYKSRIKLDGKWYEITVSSSSASEYTSLDEKKGCDITLSATLNYDESKKRLNTILKYIYTNS